MYQIGRISDLLPGWKKKSVEPDSDAYLDIDDEGVYMVDGCVENPEAVNLIVIKNNPRKVFMLSATSINEAKSFLKKHAVHA